MDRLLEGNRAGPLYRRMPAIAQVVVDSGRLGQPGDYFCMPGWSWGTMFTC